MKKDPLSTEQSQPFTSRRAAGRKIHSPRTQPSSWFKKSFWTKKRILITGICGGIFLIVALFLVLFLNAENSATAYEAQIKDYNRQLRQLIASSANTIKPFEGVEKDERVKIEVVVKKMQQNINNVKRPELSYSWLGASISGRYRAAQKMSYADQKTISTLLTKTLAFSLYQHQVADVFLDPAFSQTVSDEQSAKTLQTAWQNASNVFQKQAVPEELKAGHQILQARTNEVAGAFGSIAELYKKNDRAALMKVQEDVSAKLQSIRAVAEIFEKESAKVDSALAVAFSVR